MAFSQEEKSILTAKEVPLIQFETSGLFDAGENKAKSVMAVNLIPKVTGQQTQDGVINFSGEIWAQVTFVTISGEAAQVTKTLEFNSSAPAPELVDVSLWPEVNDYSCEVDSGDIRLNVVLSIMAAGQESVSLTQVTESENVVVSVEEQEVSALSAMTVDEVSVNEEVKVNKIIEEVLGQNASVIIRSAESEEGRVIIDGEAIVNLTVKSGENVSQENLLINFRQEMACVGAEAGQEARVYALVSGVEVSLKESKDDREETTAEVTVNVKALAQTFKTEQVSLTTDAFSTDALSFPVREAVNVYNQLQPTLQTKSVTVNLDVSSYENLDEVCFVNLSSVTPAIGGGAAAGVEATIKTTDGELDVIKAQIPFEISFNGDIMPDKLLAKVDSFHLRGGKEIEINLSVYAQFNQTVTQTLSFISSLNETEQSDESAGIEVYLVKEGDKLFDVCRKLRVRPEVVLAQNENAENLTAGDKIFVYNQQVAQF